ncbi:MAG: hypothetical protein LBD44_00785 [Spirochaetaceae bacterium]|jgi:hypothetical protein|nr:hypothetical protein [Spirochaetaceae bacterium]
MGTGNPDQGLRWELFDDSGKAPYGSGTGTSIFWDGLLKVDVYGEAVKLTLGNCYEIILTSKK